MMVKAIRGYEDSYYGGEYPTFEELDRDFIGLCEHEFYSRLNIPVWINVLEDGRVALGIFMPRHGECAQWIAPATEEQVHELRVRMLRVWAGRADTGFARYPELPRHD